MTPARKRTLKFIAYAGAAVASLVGLGWRFFRERDDIQEATGELDGAVARARELGMPLEASEFRTKPVATDEENALFLLEAIGDKYKSDELWDLVEEIVQKIGANDASAKQALLDNAELFQEFRNIAAKPRLDGKFDLDTPHEPRSAYLFTLRSIVKLLRASAYFHLCEGDLSSAIEETQYVYKLANLCTVEPADGVGFTYGMSLRLMMAPVLLQMITLFGKDSQALEQVKDLELSYPVPNLLASTLRRDFYEGLAVVRNIDQYGFKNYLKFQEDPEVTLPKLGPEKIQREGFSGSQNQRALITRHLQIWSEYWTELMLPNQHSNHLSGTLERYQKLIEDKKGLSYQIVKRSCIFSFSSLSSWQQVESERLTRLGLIEVLLYKIKYQKFPDTLAEAGFHEPDPFTQLPFQIKLEGESIQVHSKGSDNGRRINEASLGATYPTPPWT